MSQNKIILVTGGAGFIGSALIRHLYDTTNHSIVNLDALTYSGNLDSLASISSSNRYHFAHGNICDPTMVMACLETYKPDLVMHLAAESHVDRSIDEPGIFMETNVMGTFNLLRQCHEFYKSLSTTKQGIFRFHHISTDEVYGDLEPKDDAFSETTPYAPSSPYSASKASSDHLVRAWQKTYDLPTVISNCSNNYGPYQFPEKLIPHMILSALSGKALPVYGDGQQIRDWLYVDDHVKALALVAEHGEVGATYNIGGNNELSNIRVVQLICELLEELGEVPQSPHPHFIDQIQFVHDRPGHDRRYAINSKKIHDKLGWQPEESFESGLKKTIQWYLNNKQWWQRVLSGDYQLDRKGLEYDTV